MSKIVVPGELLLEKPVRMENAIVEGNRTYSVVLGIFNEEKGTLIPLEGLWYPQREDVVIGIVEEARLSSYTIDLNAPYKGIVISKYAETKLSIGDIIEASVRVLDETKTVVLSRSRKLFGGKLIEVKPSKIPRIIGKGSMMLKQIRDGTKAMIIVGMNGRVWVKGGDTVLATEAILKIVEEAHTSGLTDRIKNLLESQKKKTGV
jgi:exosome complex component RRP4